MMSRLPRGMRNHPGRGAFIARSGSGHCGVEVEGAMHQLCNRTNLRGAGRVMPRRTRAA